MRPRGLVIVGGGLAGAKAAEALRNEGFEGRVVLVGEEAERPYDRPPLSKGFLRGEDDIDKVYLHQPAFYDDRGIELRTASPVTGIDASGGAVVLGTGERLGYDRLLLATGAAPRRLRVPGADLDGIVYLRDLGDAHHLRAALAQATRVAVVGGGWIGAEVAACARQLGRDVTLLHSAAAPFQSVLGPEVANVYRALHADHGVDLQMGKRVAGFGGGDSVEEVRTTDGDRIAADVVVVGVGVVPRTELAEAAGLRVDDGIVVDEHLRTSDERILAAGDVASAWHPFYERRVRVEHWANALNQGPTAARNMLGRDEPYQRLPYFYSDQYDLGMEYLGYATDWDRVVFRGDPASGQFIAFWVKDDRVLAGMHANVWGVVEAMRHLIESRRPVDDARLADPDTPLDQLVTSA